MVRRRRKAPRRLGVYAATSRPTNRVIPFHRRRSARPSPTSVTRRPPDSLCFFLLYFRPRDKSLYVGRIYRATFCGPCRAHMVATPAILGTRCDLPSTHHVIAFRSRFPTQVLFRGSDAKGSRVFLRVPCVLILLAGRTFNRRVC